MYRVLYPGRRESVTFIYLNFIKFKFESCVSYKYFPVFIPSCGDSLSAPTNERMPTSLSQNMDRRDLRRLTRRRMRRARQPSAAQPSSFPSPSVSSLSSSPRASPWAPGSSEDDDDDDDDDECSSDGGQGAHSNPHDMLIRALIEKRQQEEEEEEEEEEAAAAAAVVTPHRPRAGGNINNGPSNSRSHSRSHSNGSNVDEDAKDATPPQGARDVGAKRQDDRKNTDSVSSASSAAVDCRAHAKKNRDKTSADAGALATPAERAASPLLHAVPLAAAAVGTPTSVEPDVGYTTTDEDGVVWKVVRSDAEGLYWEALEKNAALVASAVPANPSPASANNHSNPAAPVSRVDGADGTYSVTFHAQSLGFRFGEDEDEDGAGRGTTASGLVVVSVSEQSASASARIARGDRLVSVAGTEIGSWTSDRAGSFVRTQQRPVVLGFAKRTIVRPKLAWRRDDKAAAPERVAAQGVVGGEVEQPARTEAQSAAAAAAKAKADAAVAKAKAARAAKAKAARAAKTKKQKRKKIPKIACPYCQLNITRSNGSSKGKYIRECMNDACPTRFFRVDMVTLLPSVYKNGHRGPQKFRYQFDVSAATMPPSSDRSGGGSGAKRKRRATPDGEPAADEGGSSRCV